MDFDQIKQTITSFFNEAGQVIQDSWGTLQDSFGRVTSGEAQTDDYVTLAAGGISGVFLGSTMGLGAIASAIVGGAGMMAATYIKDNYIDQPQVAHASVMPEAPTNRVHMQP